MSLAKQRVKKFELDADELDRQLEAAMGDFDTESFSDKLNESITPVAPGSMVQAKVDSVDQRTGFVVLDIGGKSEGSIPLAEFGDVLPEPGQIFEVHYDGLGDDDTAQLSKRRADRLRAWTKLAETHKEGDEIQGICQRKIKGGLLVDVEGVNVFLPASQVNLRRTHDISDFIGEPIRARIIKIDPERMNVVVSRRKLLEEERQKKKEELLKEVAEGQVRMGVIKNIADFGVFVDLGGIDGLLHITDMSWGRVRHPSEMVEIGQEIEVKVLRVDFERERIALGLKQKQASPWDGIEERYPPESVHEGEVVNIMSYGAFVKLEDGVEGLVHISEMSWTRRINHPSELVKPGDKVSVVVLEINMEKQEVSLGMKQAETNPWDVVEEHYPPGTIIEGVVRNLTTYGAFVEIEEGIDGLLHVSDMSWTKKVSHPSEAVRKGDKLRCVVLSVDTSKKRIALGLKQLSNDPWLEQIPNNFHVGDLLSGYATKITNFGVFVKLDDNLEGLLHISELADHKIESPEEVVQPGMKIEVRVLRVDEEERKIGLSFVHADFEENDKVMAEAKAKAAAGEAAEAAEVDLSAEVPNAVPSDGTPPVASADAEPVVEPEAAPEAPAVVESEGDAQAEGDGEASKSDA